MAIQCFNYISCWWLRLRKITVKGIQKPKNLPARNYLCCSLFCLVCGGPQAARMESSCLWEYFPSFSFSGSLISLGFKTGRIPCGGITAFLIFSVLGSKRSLPKAGQYRQWPNHQGLLYSALLAACDASSLTPWTINVSLCLFWTLMFIAY